MDYSNLPGMIAPAHRKVDHNAASAVASVEGLLMGIPSNQLLDACAKRLFNGENSNISDYSLFNLWSLLDHAITERGQQRFEQEAHTDASMYYDLESYEEQYECQKLLNASGTGLTPCARSISKRTKLTKGIEHV